MHDPHLRAQQHGIDTLERGSPKGETRDTLPSPGVTLRVPRVGAACSVGQHRLPKFNSDIVCGGAFEFVAHRSTRRGGVGDDVARETVTVCLASLGL